MRPVTDTWEQHVKHSYRAVTKVEVLHDGNVTEIEVTDEGDVVHDFFASNRGRCELTVVDPDLLTTGSADDLLAPYGNELRIWRGLCFGATLEPEWVSLGIFGIDDLNLTENGGDLTMRVVGIDRSKRVERYSFEAPKNIAAGTSIQDAIVELVEEAIPGVDTTGVGADDISLPHITLQEGEDRWAACRAIAKACGCDVFFDGDGKLVMRPIAATSSVFDITDGEEGVLVSVSKQFSREGMSNYVVASGENSNETPVSATAIDDDELSPTYYLGKFGRVPSFYQSRYIIDSASAQDGANGVLAARKGLASRVDLGMVPNPALEPGDVVRVTRELDSGEQLVNDQQVLDVVSIGLGPTVAMNCQARSVEQALAE